jgi:hypothetical protein
MSLRLTVAFRKRRSLLCLRIPKVGDVDAMVLADLLEAAFRHRLNANGVGVELRDDTMHLERIRNAEEASHGQEADVPRLILRYLLRSFIPKP